MKQIAAVQHLGTNLIANLLAKLFAKLSPKPGASLKPRRGIVRKPLVGAILVAFFLCGTNAIQAADLVVMSAGAAKEAVLPLAEQFAKQSGHKVSVSYGTMGLIQEKLSKGEKADVLIVAAEVADAMQKAGTIVADSRRPLARTGVGVAVHESAASPDISTPEAFKALLLSAKSIVMINPARGTSGKHLVEVYARLGVTDAIKGKMQYGEGGTIVIPVGEGMVELGLHQISEILPVKGVKLVGPLPEALQKWTLYTAAITPGSASAAAARELIAFLSSAAARSVYLSKGFTAAD